MRSRLTAALSLSTNSLPPLARAIRYLAAEKERDAAAGQPLSLVRLALERVSREEGRAATRHLL